MAVKWLSNRVLPLQKRKTPRPKSRRFEVFRKATGRIRTDDLRFTKASLCQLSYGGLGLGSLTDDDTRTLPHLRWVESFGQRPSAPALRWKRWRVSRRAEVYSSQPRPESESCQRSRREQSSRIRQLAAVNSAATPPRIAAAIRRNLLFTPREQPSYTPPPIRGCCAGGSARGWTTRRSLEVDFDDSSGADCGFALAAHRPRREF